MLGMVDQDETDWKVITISTCERLVNRIHNIHDIQNHMSTWLDTTRDWLRTYKILEGKAPNSFLFNGDYQDASFTKKKHCIRKSSRMEKLLSTPSKC